MSITVRDLIINALSRANLCSKRQAAPGYMTESAFELLNGIAGKYSKDNLLQFLRRELLIPAEMKKTTLVIGEYGLNDEYSDYLIFDTLPEAASAYVGRKAYAKDTQKIYICATIPTGYAWGMTSEDPHTVFYSLPDIELPNVASIAEVYARNGKDEYNNDYELGFVAYEDFRNPMYGVAVYTWQPMSDKSIELKFKKPMMDTAPYGFAVIYNCGYKFGLDDTLKIPENYVELFTAALVYALAVKYPKLDQNQVNRLLKEKEDLEKNVAVPTRANKLVLRNHGHIHSCLNMSNFVSGGFILQ